ncbi:MAG TPA: T9SS type A sorting domain-containing protein [Candidatus Kapabacteria bacterium]|nr:T9SS type A sorting domain-containing protein [Candidatus Kapabacteria bacterium]
MTYNLYGDQSDPGPFPIPPDALVEASGDPNGDHHVLIVDTGRCMLYEFWRAQKDSTDDNWSSANGATFALSSNHYRPDTWTSGDAAGLPIFPGLVRYDEVRSGEITHAVRFTTDTSSKAWIFPARHHAGKYFDTTYPPMGLRLRLKAGYDISGFTGESLIILKALKKYGMILADNGGSWFISGATDNRWTVNDDNDLNHLKSVPGSAFEVVDMGYRIETDGDTITLPGDSLPVTQTPVRETVPPLNFSLDQNAPNPFSNNTVLHFITPANTRVMLNVYDALGRQVTTLVNGLVTAGEHTAAFSATGLPAGVYFARLQTGGTVIQRMMQVLR